MKKILLFLSLVFCASVTLHDPHYAILAKEDFEMAKNDRYTPAITWPQGKGLYLASFNEWRCFSTENISFELATINYGEQEHCVPTVEITDHQQVLNFDLDPDVDWNCDKVLKTWEEVAKNQDSLCVYGAFSSKLEDNHFLWYLEKIKTNRGYWNRSEIEDLINAEDDSVSEENP